MAKKKLDAGATETQKKLDDVEGVVRRAYKVQKREMAEKVDSFMKNYEIQNKEKLAALAAGKITQESYDKWLQGKAFREKWLTEMVKQISTDLTLTDVKAMSIVNGFLPEAYAINRNFGAFEVEKGALVRTSFTMYDAPTVQRLIKEKPNLIPKPSPNIPKDMRWNQEKITIAVRNGIMQGESVDKIAARLQTVTDMDENAAIRNARTATTAAQNAGRVDSYKEAEELGISMRQRWVASLDDRTRDSHRLLDGEMVEVGEKFSNGCRYPGDPSGDPSEIYNCRCTLIAVIAKSQGGRGYVGAERASKLGTMSYEEWKYEKNPVAKYEHQMSVAQKQLAKLSSDAYVGIWKDPVYLSDYPSKKDAIQGKKDYYESEIQKMKDAGKDDKVAYLEGKLNELKEFEAQGALYEKYSTELAEATQKWKDAKGAVGPFTPDAYSDARESAARRFSSRREADRILRPELDAQWGTLEDREKYGVWKYTENSNPMNKPLSGYEESWSRDDFKGVGQARWDSEDRWRSNPSAFKKFGHSDGHVDHAQAIADLTTAIEKCELSEDMWFVRGSDLDGLAGLLDGDLLSFADARRLLAEGDITALQSALNGQVFQSHSFLSTGIAGDAGFGGDVSYRIYAPKGTKCIYAEPQSHFGQTVGRGSPRLYRAGESYYGVGSEAEQIFQRGTKYRVKSIEGGHGSYRVTLEVVDQPDYFKTGFEQTSDGGKTSWPHK